MKKLLLLFALGILITASHASAEVELREAIKLEFEQNKVEQLKVPCFNNGSYCSSSASCNITIIHKGESVMQNRQMQNQVQFHNVTLSKTNNFKIGDYEATVTCRDSGLNGFTTFGYIVTPSGNDDSGLNQLMLLGMGCLFSIGFIWLGFYKNEPYLVLFSGIALTLLGIFIMNNGIGNYRNQLTLMISVVATGVAAFISLKTGMEIINENM